MIGVDRTRVQLLYLIHCYPLAINPGIRKRGKASHAQLTHPAATWIPIELPRYKVSTLAISLDCSNHNNDLHIMDFISHSDIGIKTVAYGSPNGHNLLCSLYFGLAFSLQRKKVWGLVYIWGVSMPHCVLGSQAWGEASSWSQAHHEMQKSLMSCWSCLFKGELGEGTIFLGHWSGCCESFGTTIQWWAPCQCREQYSLLKSKHDGRVKARTCTNGSTQCAYMECDDGLPQAWQQWWNWF